MKIGVLTSLYPAPQRPFEGVFAERRWLGMKARGHSVRVVHTLPWAPGFVGGWRAELRAMPSYEDRSGIPVVRPRYLHVPKLPRRNARAFAKVGVTTLLAGERPDVVIADYAWPASQAVHELAEHGIPCVVHGRGSDVLEVAGEAGLGDELALNLKASAGWCAVSLDLLATMDRLGEAPGRGVLTPNGVEFDVFHPRDREACRRELGQALEGQLVLVVGHLIRRKDPLLALEAFARHAPESARLAFLGRGELKAELEARVAELGLGARVELVGEVHPSQLATWYGASDALLLTSSREGRPNVVIESLASGRPAIATSAGGTAELLRGMEERLLVTEREADAVGRKLAGILADPPTTSAIRALVEHLSWDSSLAALEKVLETASAVRVSS